MMRWMYTLFLIAALNNAILNTPIWGIETTNSKNNRDDKASDRKESVDQKLSWPQFRGPGGNGIAENQKPPVEFGPKKNLLWKIPVPSGFSSPIITGNLLILTGYDQDKLYTIAYNSKDGKELWKVQAPTKKIEPFLKGEGSPAASTPVTDGERIVSYFGSCGLFCYDLSGKELWKMELPTVETKNSFGTGVSPILADGIVILQRDETKQSKILAVDLKDGRLIWEKSRQSPCSWSTPTIWNTPEGKQIVTTGYKLMIGYDLKTGNELWHIAGMPSAVCPTAVVSNGNLFFSGWSPGAAEDKDTQMPSFDAMLKSTGQEKEGVLSRASLENTQMKNFFDSFDSNKDGKISRNEWEDPIKFMSASVNSTFAVKPGGKGDISKTHVLWRKTKGMPYVPSSLIYGGQFVIVKDGGLVTAYDPKSGKEIYVLERAVAAGRYYASPVAANGHIYFTSLDQGEVTVLKAGAEMPEVIAKNPKLGERVAATPAIADNTIFIRGEKNLYAFAEKK